MKRIRCDLLSETKLARAKLCLPQASERTGRSLPSAATTVEKVLRRKSITVPCAPFRSQLYHHGESIAVNVHIANNSSKTVKKIKVSVRQFADICLFSTAQYKCTVAEVESE